MNDESWCVITGEPNFGCFKIAIACITVGSKIPQALQI